MWRLPEISFPQPGISTRVNPLESLADRRHVAFQKAKARNFAGAALTQAWREANRAYVLARDRKPSSASVRHGGRPRLQLSAGLRASRLRGQKREHMRRARRSSNAV